ncbi:MAG: tetratricopeptide repeat protein [candidate division Zixibacteria bacterium]|nr:tetratricopeptide repeat protein [candidate division Zixibacteria bacterium]MCI0597044.1 tetratricopeptide repeat protein [candidate division Zixibacteria bacterium]
MKRTALIFALLTLAFGCTRKNDEAVVQKLYTQGQIAMNQAKFDSALVIYDSILKKYPDHPKNDRALFLMGYIENEFLGNKEKAKVYFNDLMARYPKSDLIKDAQFLLSGETPKI